MPKILLEQGSVEWLEYRRHHIMSTDASIIIEVNPWKSQKDIWEEKLGIKEPDQLNDAMKRGSELEPIARDLFIKYNQIDCKPCVWESDEYPWIATSLDGITHFGFELIEIKCGSQKLHDMAKEGVYPIYYHCQIQHHFLCTGLNEGFYISYRPEDEERPYIQFSVHSCKDYMEILLKKEKEFWKKICNFEEPKTWTFKENN